MLLRSADGDGAPQDPWDLVIREQMYGARLAAQRNTRQEDARRTHVAALQALVRMGFEFDSNAKIY
jgi:hypothetical protein